MSQGDVLQKYNNQLINIMKEMHTKKDNISIKIATLDEQQQNLTNQTSILNEQLSTLDESLVENRKYKEKLEKMITETETAYMKILESSQTLLIVLKREQNTLGL